MSYCEVNNFVPIGDLVARVQMILSEVSPTIVEAILREQAILFADDTKAIEVTIFEDAQTGVSGYPVQLPNCLEPRIVRSVEYNGVCYERIQSGSCLGQAGTSCSRRSGACGTGSRGAFHSGPSGFVAETPAWIELYPAPGVDEFNAIRITAVAGIAADACEIPKDLATRWGSYIVAGTLSVLYGMKGEDWYNASNVDRYAEQMKSGFNAVKRDVTLAATGGEGIPIGGDPWVL